MEIRFIPVDFGYFDYNGENYIKLIGRNSKGRKVCVIDSYKPNFWIILDEGADAKTVEKSLQGINVEKSGRKTSINKTEIHKKKFLGEDVEAIRVFIDNHKDSHEIASEIGDNESIYKRREYDIPIITKYIKEKKVEPLEWYDVEVDDVSDGEFGDIKSELNIPVYVSKKFKTIDKQPDFNPRILSYDIETSNRKIGDGEIFMISVYGKNAKKVFTWKKVDSAQDYVEFCKNEKEMIKSFSEFVRKYDADILAGYFSDGFDLPFIKKRADKFKINLDLGVDGKGPIFNKSRIPSGKINGLVHFDIYKFIDSVFSQYLQSETLSLDEVAKELIGESKEEFDFKKLKNMSEQDWKEFFSYNLQDSAATYKLAERLWLDTFGLCRIIKEPLFDVTRDRMSAHVENHIIHNLDRFNEIAEKRPGYDEISIRKTKTKFEGALVKEPKPGFYEDIVMFDFTSMHASIIVSFNISKATIHMEKTDDVYESPKFELDNYEKRVYFDKKQGFFSTLLSEIVDKRKEYKKEYAKDKNPLTKARSNAYKLLANATFGYQGFFGARYYSREAAAATLAFVRKFTTDTMSKIENEGFEVIYSDTDSIAFLNNGKTKKQIEEFLKKLNEDLPGIMELDLEDFYKRGIFVSKRGGDSKTNGGAKKKYALLDSDDKIKIRGFETVRRDWCPLSRKLQSDILEKILREGNEKSSVNLTKDIVEKLKKRQIDKNELLVKTKLKRNLNEYTSMGPHVIAAKKIGKTGIPVEVGMPIEYYIGESNKKLIRDKVALPEENKPYDIDYYLNKQIIPAIENIFEVFGVNVKEVIEGESQKKLF